MKYTSNQQKAINYIDENLQIIACAGSGKTQVISERIVNILENKTEISPQNILAFTYTEKAASELKERVLRLCRERIGNIEGIAEMYIGTIHAWCLRILQDYILDYQKFSILDEIKLKLFIDRNFSKIGMADLGMRKYLDTGHFVQLMTIVRESELSQGLPQDISTALDKYENCLLDNCYFDFTMIQTKLIENFKADVDFKSKLEQKIKYLIVDEYQDVNPIQEKIIENLYDLGVNLCVVGDDDQTIYEWRGSQISNIINFANKYNKKGGNITHIKLEDNFRSSRGIVETAENVIDHNSRRLIKVMQSSGHHQYERGDLLYEQFTNQDQETEFIIRTIKNLRGKKYYDSKQSSPRGIDYSDFAILIRRWANAGEISRHLREENIPYIVTGVNQLLEQPEIQASIAIFNFINKQLDGDTLGVIWQDLCNYKLNETKLKNAILKLEKKREFGDYYENFIIQEVFIGFLDDIGLRESIFPEIPESKVAGDTQGAIIFYNLGMFSQVIDDFETINFVSNPKIKLRNFLNFLRFVAADYYSEGWLRNNFRTPNAVQIMTIYQSKGLEFPVVFIPWLNKNNFPIKRRSGITVLHFLDRSLIKDQQRYERNFEAERRLLYVGITRAKKYLFLSRGSAGKLYGRESEFGTEIRDSDYIFSSPFRDFSERKSIEPKPYNENGIINLNFSVLKSFYECNYKFKFYSLYGFRNPLGARIGYGRSIHNVLMELHRRALEGEVISKDEIPNLVEKHSNFPYAVMEAKRDMKKKASKNIEKYMIENENDFPNIEYAEKDIEINLGDGIMVQGRMDLIKKKKLDGTLETSIVEYKSTESSQAYNVTMGQLELYSLGYEALTGEKADFLEIFNVDENTRHRSELTRRAMASMNKTVLEAAEKIRKNELNNRCEKQDCVCRFQQ